jgi:hypothetical protein
MAPEAIWIRPWETTALNCYAMRNPHLLTGFWIGVWIGVWIGHHDPESSVRRR